MQNFRGNKSSKKNQNVCKWLQILKNQENNQLHFLKLFFIYKNEMQTESTILGRKRQ